MEAGSDLARALDERALLDDAPDAIIGVDSGGLIRFVSRQVRAVFGYEPEELVGRSVEVLVPDRDREIHTAHRARYGRHPNTRPMGRKLPLVARRKDGTEFPVDIALSSHAVDGAPLVLAAVRDITERRAAEEALRQANERFRAAFEDAPIGMALIDMDGRPVQVNEALCRLLGESEETLLAGPSSPLSGHGLAIAASARRLLEGTEAMVREERRYVRPDGRIEWFLVGTSVLSGADGRPAHFMIHVEDITAAKESEEQLAHQALHDPLTGLANRTLVADRIEHALARSRRTGSGVGLLFLDLDHFKAVNDSLGHDAGDRLLASVGERLRILLREGDTAGRLGGDEFVLVCEDLGGEAEAREVAGRVARTLEAPFVLEGRDVIVSASIGIVLVQNGASTPQAMLRDADAAMYRAKRGGRSRYEMFDDVMRLRAIERLEIGADLRSALTSGQLEVFYQPQVRLRTGELAGFEALVRWHHPHRGLLPPTEFIAIAEETGAIVPLGTWVLEQACRDAAGWMTVRPDLTLSVNLSSRELADPNLPGRFARILDESGLRPSALCLEITESSITRSKQSASNSLATVRALGVRLSIDDCGTGPASLTFLAQLRPDELKIDQSFVQQLGQTDVATAIVTSIVALAHSLRLDAVAEGVETEAQRLVVESLACERGQGFLFGRPVPSETVGSMLRDHAVTGKPFVRPGEARPLRSGRLVS